MENDIKLFERLLDSNKQKPGSQREKGKWLL